MASTIISRTVSAVVDQRLGFSASYITRPIGQLDWRGIRVGLRVNMTNTGANIAGTPRFFVGVCSGTTAPAGSVTPKHTLGIISTSATWIFGAVGIFNYTTGFAAAQYINGSLTTAGAQSMRVAAGANAAPSGVRRLLFVDMVKSGSNVAVSALWCSATVAAPDVLAADYLEIMERSGALTGITNHTYLSVGTLAVNEAVNGYLDTVNLWWSDGTTTIEDCDIGFRVLS